MLSKPSSHTGKVPTVPPAGPPETRTEMRTAASEQKLPAEVEWSATGEEPIVAGTVPPAQSWTVMPVVPAGVERPDWPDFLITLEAAQREQDGEEGDA
jgi:hypothetical protein